MCDQVLLPGINTIQDAAPPCFLPDPESGYFSALSVSHEGTIRTVVVDVQPGGVLNAGNQRDVPGRKDQREIRATVTNQWPAVTGSKVVDGYEIIMCRAQVAACIDPMAYSCPVRPGS